MPLFFLVVGLVLLGGVATAKVFTSIPKASRDMSQLNPSFRDRAEKFLAAARAAGLPLIVTETFRTPERQAYLYGSGRPGYEFEGIVYGRPGPILTQRSPASQPSEHQKRNPDGTPGAKAIDTIPDPKNSRMPGVKADSKDAVTYLRMLEPLAAEYGLKNLPSINDYGHWENA